MLGKVLSLWRYPVKSMLGERIERAEVGERGFAGDRGYAILDVTTGKVASAKHPRIWSGLFGFRATYDAEPEVGSALPPVRITLPSGEAVGSDDAAIDAALSDALGRKVVLIASPPERSRIDEEWPDLEGVGPHRATTTEESIAAAAPGTFFDAAALHVVTTSTLRRLAELYPAGRFDERRFRPNVIVETDGSSFLENEWVGREIAIGDAAMQTIVPTPRCIMTTLPQGDLPSDAGILRTPAQHNRLEVPTYGPGACVGVYGIVSRPGAVGLGASVTEAK